jgi:hypothetical protein
MFDDCFRPVLLDPDNGFLEQAVQISRVVANCDKTDYGRLPDILTIDLGDGYIKLFRQSCQQRFDDAPFRL